METALKFGREDNLVGILGQPTQAVTQTSPGVLFLNAGVEHRVGPRGLYTALARALNDAGYATLRFDFGGLGESRKPSIPVSSDRVIEMRSECATASDTLIRHAGVASVVVCGLCSGADDAFRYALSDSRVAGVAMIDGYALPTTGFRIRYYLQRLVSLRRWRNAWQRYLHSERQPDVPDPGLAADDLYFFAMPDRDALAGDLAQLLARDVQLFCVYSGGVQDVYNYGSQFADAFPDLAFGSALSEHFVPAADHTFSRSDARAELIARLRDWMDSAFTAQTRAR
ncbi:hypothetical protein [Salinisphaera sp. T31B1]|uniref:hypothetical protein n=1 Tax=Salinisphaera sp. T31B1 TaxID=727963 RepID=UPI0033419A66